MTQKSYPGDMTDTQAELLLRLIPPLIRVGPFHSLVNKRNS
jgi:hypothetical protein